MLAPDNLDLRDIHLPPPISIWPLAPGWYIAAGLLLSGLAVLGLLLYRYHRREHNRRLALRQLAHIVQEYHHTAQTTHSLAALNRLLRQVALLYYPPQQVASLHGSAWLSFLDNSIHTRAFTQDAGRLLSDIAYQDSSTADPAALFALAKQWITQVKTPRH